MRNRSSRSGLCLGLLSLSALIVSADAGAAGFEKSVMWSGKYAGIGSAAVGSVAGSQSLYFNPAGLASPSDVSLNFSPTWINTDGNLVTLSRTDESRPGLLPFGGAFASYGSGRWGFGAGAYVAGGEKAIYNGVDLTADSNSNITYQPILETDLTIMEYSLGGAMEVIPGLRLGAAWRIDQAKGTLSTIKKTIANTAYSHLVIKDAKDTRYNGYRVGAMYVPEDKKWSAGATYRSKMVFDAAGAGSGETIVIPLKTFTPQVVENTRVGLTLPSALTFGGHYGVTDVVKVFAAADYVKYSQDDKIYVTGTANGITLPNIPLNWSDMWNFRLGLEYTGINALALRAGYVHTSQVTSSTDAKATLPPPGAGNLFTIGAGYAVMQNLDLDGALEYAHAEGEGSMSVPGATDTTKELLAGIKSTSKASSYGVHTGVTYRF